MLVYRIAKKERAQDLSGYSASLVGGRWNSPGNSALYTSSSRALAMLSLVAYIAPETELPTYDVVEILIPEQEPITTLDVSILPENWRNYNLYDFTRLIGDNWLKNNFTLALKVPSALITSEFDIIINPAHKDFKEIKIVSTSSVIFDERIKLSSIIPKIVPIPLSTKAKIAKISEFEFDIFISHASEDKETIVIPIVKEINKIGLRYWFDKERIGWGESITKSINHGIKNSRYVLAVLSITFLKKPWAMAELQTALNKQISNKEVFILPILVGSKAEIEEILNAIPLLKDNRYEEWSNNPEHIVALIKKQLDV